MRPTVARVVNEDNYRFGTVRYESNGRVEFEEEESIVWSGMYTGVFIFVKLSEASVSSQLLTSLIVIVPVSILQRLK